MKTVGVIGGMTWESSIEYYRLMNEAVKRRLGGLHSAKVLMYSLDFQPIADMQGVEDWDGMGRVMVDAGIRLEKAGADAIVIATNTMHKLADLVKEAVNIPLLHIADAVAAAAKIEGVRRLGLLGTKFTMEQDFYREALGSHGLEVVIPDGPDRETVHRVIYDELSLGYLNPESREAFLRIIRGLALSGAEGVVLGCTEIPLLIQQEHVEIPVFDTTKLHAEMAVDWAINTR